MLKRLTFFVIIFLLLIIFSIKVREVKAFPLISINDYTIKNNNIFNVDVLISGVSASLPVQAFEFDIDYDSSIITPLSISDGGYLPSPLGIPPLVIESDLNPPDINFAMTTIGWGGGSGSGILATITFQGIGIGISSLDLNDVILSAPGGIQITPIILNDGSVNVISEPATFILIGSGIIGIFGLKSKRDNLR